MQLTCPIRGILNTEDISKDGLSFTEEYQRIECIKFLLSKGYPIELFEFEKTVMSLGNSGKNRLRADIVIYDDEFKKNILLIVEVKKDSKSKESAIKFQLMPPSMSWKTKFSIYYDGVENCLFKNNNFDKELSLLSLPNYGFDADEEPLKFINLIQIKDIKNILAKINQILHNIGRSKDFRYQELFKVIDSANQKSRSNGADGCFNHDGANVSAQYGDEHEQYEYFYDSHAQSNAKRELYESGCTHWP